MPRPKTKTISFFRLYVVDEARRKDATVDWRGQLVEIAKAPMIDRTRSGVIYDPHVTDDAVLLGVHVPLNTDFMTRIDPAASTVMEEHEGEEDGAGFANSTAVCFLPRYNVVAVAVGGANSPRGPSVAVNFATSFVPLGPGAHWVGEPLMDGDRLRAFEEAGGAVAFSSRFSTTRNLLTPDEGTGIASYADAIARRIGGEIEVDISIRIAPESRNRSVKQRFRDMIRGELPRFVHDRASRTKVVALMDGGVEEELDLVAHRLAASIEVDSETSESHRFSTLLEHLSVVSGEMDDRVRDLIEGGDHGSGAK
jgi:hypothetical protein